ncbi:MAG TPA: thiamine-phosphate kinase [Phycisphaerae bacterium]|nr:thiamine-phosphate kinase [Phycisphaerae bacterium]
MRENDFLNWIRENSPPHPAVKLGIGDDMAAVDIGDSLAVLKTDQCLDQVHFDLRQHTATQAGRKAVNRCLSDCAGMGCLPAALMISVALPKDGPGSGEGFAKELFLACRNAGAEFDCPLVGGDTSMWDQRLAITVSALGRIPQNQHLITRSGARPGDTLFVSGALGGSLLPGGGGRHLTFTPRIELAQRIIQAAGLALHAMMDLSDGLSQDLPRLCAASHVGAQIHTARLPTHDDAWKLAQKDSLPAGFHALADGEDYELLFALDPNSAPEIVNLSNIPLTAIGTVTSDPRLLLVDDHGKTHVWPRAGWEHHS